MPELFGWQHLTYLAIFFVVFITTLILAKIFIKTEKQKTIMLKTVAGILFVLIIINRISVAIRNQNFWSIIPNTYCGMTSLVFSLVVLFGKPNMKSYNFLFYVAFVGGLATMIYPDFLGQNESFFYLPTISGLLHHSVLLLLSCLLVELGWFKPTSSGVKWFAVGVCVYTIVGLFMIDIFNLANAMCINEPLIDGTPLNWWFILIVGSVALWVVLFAYEKIKECISKNKANKIAVEK